MKKRVPNDRPTRGRFKSLRVSNGFRDFILDQLAGVPDLKAKAMFGGIGLYAGDVFFGILAADVLYLKVGDANRADFERAGAAPFQPYADGRVSMTYYTVPAPVLEHAGDLAQWAARSIEVARRVRATPVQRTSRRRR
jgi:DNA transformation protein and related proteins